MDPKSIPAGGPAFPTDSASQVGSETWHHEGMTLRDYFAAAALQGICAHPDTWGLLQTGIARAAYDMADEMIKARG